ncbi:hypothetical protein KI387_000949, partial [Taxus chinensis]
MATPKEHIEQIRLRKFLIGGEKNPLSRDLYHAVKHLSSELYTKDIHFIMELIQNAEDNEYPPNVEASLEFVFTSRDITGTGAPGTLLVFNNEKGFSKDNIESLCSVGHSTKRGKRQGGGYIGEKGIGFKSVFLVTSQPYIFSNGYKIRFNEVPTPETGIGYIVPEWIDDKPSIEDLQQVYGKIAELPNTIIVLPLKPEKVVAVKNQVSDIHPEVILFMSKIKRLSVREDNVMDNLVETQVSVSLETAFQTVKNEESESFILHLAAEENEEWSNEGSYYMWRQRFPAKAENWVEGRKDIKTWVITLAFPCEERVVRRNNHKRRRITKSNKVGAGIYAFLPTQILTGFPFIIQADFLLVSSRESIIWDNKWNRGILNCIPSAFCTAFHWLLQSVGSAPISSRSYCFKYLPISMPFNHQLKLIRSAIQMKLKNENVVLCESETGYCKPEEALNILPDFRNILETATEKPSYLLSDKVFIIHSCMDDLNVLNFLGVRNADDKWYAKCIQSSSWVAGLSEDLYVELLCFIAAYWEKGIPTSPGNFLRKKISDNLHCFPLFKYEDYPNGVGWASLSDISTHSCRIYFSSEAHDIEWLTRWKSKFGDVANYKFIPNATQKSISDLEKSSLLKLQEWLSHYPAITELSVSSFTKQLIQEAQVSASRKFVISVTQFLHYSSANQYFDIREICNLRLQMPIVSESGTIVKNPPQERVFIPASTGKWAKLMGSNPWEAEGYVTLSSKYMKIPPCAVGLKGGNDLELFIKDELGAMDIP